MDQYLDMLTHVMKHGKHRENRTGTDTIGVFGYQMRFNLRESFPIVTTKKMFFRGIVQELLWMLRGNTHVQSLQQEGIHIWDAWGTKEQCAKFGRTEGDLGPTYGHQWRAFGGVYENPNDIGIDQIHNAIEQILYQPNSRRIIVSGWNPRDADKVSLPPCHTLYQFYVQDGELSLSLYQRSADAFLGVPFNISSYALLTNLVAQAVGLKVGDFIHNFGDLHVYKNHIPQVYEQLKRAPKALPKLSLKLPDLFDMFPKTDTESSITRVVGRICFPDDVQLVNYECHEKLSGDVAI